MSTTADPAAPSSATRKNRVWIAAQSDLPMLCVLLALTAATPTRQFAATNLAVQAVLCLFIACIPAYRTGVMAYVDIAWSWGLAAIGVQILVFADDRTPAVVALAGVYVAMGARMGVWMVRHMVAGFPADDLPRYRYQRRRWRRQGYSGDRLPMQHEILQQAGGNASLLAAPAILVAAHPDLTVVALVLGLALWGGAWALESVADLQKSRFVAGGGLGTCEVGLWAHSRHPNYFFQWLQWHGPVLMAVPAFLSLRDDTPVLGWIVIGVGLLGVSPLMARVLITYTGARPAEYYSVRKRPDYADYQRRVNMFVPGPARRREDTGLSPEEGAAGRGGGSAP